MALLLSTLGWSNYLPLAVLDSSPFLAMYDNRNSAVPPDHTTVTQSITHRKRIVQNGPPTGPPMLVCKENQRGHGLRGAWPRPSTSQDSGQAWWRAFEQIDRFVLGHTTQKWRHALDDSRRDPTAQQSHPGGFAAEERAESPAAYALSHFPERPNPGESAAAGPASASRPGASARGPGTRGATVYESEAAPAEQYAAAGRAGRDAPAFGAGAGPAFHGRVAGARAAVELLCRRRRRGVRRAAGRGCRAAGGTRRRVGGSSRRGRRTG